MDAPVGTLLAYATSPGAVASDGSGANGLYTQHLLNAIAQPGNKVEDVFKQVPWESTSLEGDFYFRSGPAPAKPVDPAEGMETALWSAVKDSKNVLELQVYLNRYPSGLFAAEAMKRLSNLQVASTEAAKKAQAAIDNRAAELMASLVAPAKPLPAASPAKEKKPARSATASNSVGFSVGDTYRYQIVDNWKKEVVGNENYKISKILANGDMEWNDGKIIASPDGEFRRSVRAQGTYEYSPKLEWMPKELRVGYKQAVEFVVTRTTVDFLQTERHKGALAVKGIEKVTVPAGEFEAFRIESEANFTGERNNGSRGWNGRSVVVFWYVPSLLRYVAVDQEVYINGRLDTRQRFELTSFSVRGAQELAQR
jgi:plastocyanin